MFESWRTTPPWPRPCKHRIAATVRIGPISEPIVADVQYKSLSVTAFGQQFRAACFFRPGVTEETAATTSWSTRPAEGRHGPPTWRDRDTPALLRQCSSRTRLCGMRVSVAWMLAGLLGSLGTAGCVRHRRPSEGEPAPGTPTVAAALAAGDLESTAGCPPLPPISGFVGRGDSTLLTEGLPVPRERLEPLLPTAAATYAQQDSE